MPYTMDENQTSFGDVGKISARTLDIGRAIALEPDSTYEDIAFRFGVSRQRIGQIAKRFSVGRRKVDGYAVQ
jgi:uncharacterized protein YdbL (DUF1318 family)